jgi:hypothetical protein
VAKDWYTRRLPTPVHRPPAVTLDPALWTSKMETPYVDPMAPKSDPVKHLRIFERFDFEVLAAQPTDTDNVAVDVYGRRFDTRVPVFLKTNSPDDLLYDRLHNGRPGKRPAFVDESDLRAYAAEHSIDIHPNEIGEAPDWWLANNPWLAKFITVPTSIVILAQPVNGSFVV